MVVYSAMAGNPSPPDYDLADRIALTDPAQVKAIGHPLRTTILSLLHERAATVTELAVALERPKSTVAHHVKVLTETGLVQVVRTRRVRAIEERFYGRTARMFYVAAERAPDGDDLPRDFNDFEVAARESASAYLDGKLWGFIRHARISEPQVSEFWERMAELVAEFDQLPRSGETVYGFAVGVYPTDHPTLPG
jgi:DNA-binding transcriptional ArsR family regulator